MVGKGFPSQGSPSLSSVTQESPRRECILKGNDVGGRRVSQESPGLGSRPRRDDSRSLPKPSASAAALTGESPAQLGGGPMDPRRFRSSLVPGTQLRKTWFLPSKDVQPRKRLSLSLRIPTCTPETRLYLTKLQEGNRAPLHTAKHLYTQGCKTCLHSPEGGALTPLLPAAPPPFPSQGGVAVWV